VATTARDASAIRGLGTPSSSSCGAGSGRLGFGRNARAQCVAVQGAQGPRARGAQCDARNGVHP
jgi:hypothetical protein